MSELEIDEEVIFLAFPGLENVSWLKTRKELSSKQLEVTYQLIMTSKKQLECGQKLYELSKEMLEKINKSN